MACSLPEFLEQLGGFVPAELPREKGRLYARKADLDQPPERALGGSASGCVRSVYNWIPTWGFLDGMPGSADRSLMTLIRAYGSSFLQRVLNRQLPIR
jgi:hypothetical protein